MHQPLMSIHWPAIGTSMAAAFAFGTIWYGALFGKTWMKLAGIKPMKNFTGAMMLKINLIALVGMFFTSYVLAHSVLVWRASSWGITTGDLPNHMYGFMGGFFTWLGFYVPQHLGVVTWEGKSWKLFFLHAAHSFLSLQIVAQILAHWRG